MPRPVYLKRKKNRGVPKRVAVDFFSRRVTRMKIQPRCSAIHDADGWRHMSIQSTQPICRRESAVGDIGVCALPYCMHSSICPAGAMHNHSFLAKDLKCFLQCILSSIPAHLTLPAGECGALICDSHAQSHICESSQLWSRICAAT